jgi:hypothetical protein
MSFAYLLGDAWHGKDDCAGMAFETSGLSRDHREYLTLGGLGSFWVTDGSTMAART